MNSPIWLAIAMVIVPLINHWAIEVWKDWRRSRSKAIPEQKQPKVIAAPTSRLSKGFSISWGVMFGFVVPLALLVVAMTRSDPLSRWSVLTISIGVGWIFLQLSIVLSAYVSTKVWKAMSDTGV